MRRPAVVLLAATTLALAAGCSPGADPLGNSPASGLVVITAGGLALTDGGDEVPPTLDLRLSSGAPLLPSSAAARLDDTTLDLVAAGSGALTATTPALALCSTHRLEVTLGGERRSIRFRVACPAGVAAAFHLDVRAGAVLDVAFASAPDQAAVARAVPGGAAAWRDAQHLRVTWPSPPGGRFHLPASLPTRRGAHLAADVDLSLDPLPAGSLRQVVVPAAPALQPTTVLAFTVGTAASRASLRAHASAISIAAPTGLRALDDGGLAGAPDAAAVGIAGSAGVPVWPVLENDGFDTTTASTLLRDPTRVATLVGGLRAAAAAGAWQGITLDFEEISPDDRDALTGLVGRLAAGLHADGRRLAVAVVPSKPGGANLHSAAYDLGAIAQAADLVVVMAYEEHSALDAPGAVAGVAWDRDLLAGTLPALQPGRALLGVPLYARAWGDSPGADSYRSSLTAALDRPGATVDYDFSAAVTCIRSDDGSATYLEDAGSLLRKAALVGEEHLGGLALWRLGFEDPAVWSALPATAPRP